ncbi:MAG: XRE family transcriptional regulator [Acidobacteria bacterium]|nr:MAG: XRE family transcriptional regulator [Acidobacteriota bacterium]
MNYSKAIRIVRAARGFSQKRLAAVIGVDPSYISLLETGKRVPSLEVLESLAKALRIPIHLLLLLASEPEDLRGVGVDEAQQIGRQLLEILIENSVAP